MNKFNVGDKVVCVNAENQSELILGEEYFVSSFEKDEEEASQSWVGVIGLRFGTPVIDASRFELVDRYTPDETIPPEVVALGDKLVPTQTEWTDKHYDAIYKLTEKDIERGWIKIDPYRVSKQWRLGSKDESGALFHVLKTLARIGEKNSVEREVKALLAQIKCFAEIEGIDYD